MFIYRVKDIILSMNTIILESQHEVLPDIVNHMYTIDYVSFGILQLHNESNNEAYVTKW
jgi:hypothetical protein